MAPLTPSQCGISTLQVSKISFVPLWQKDNLSHKTFNYFCRYTKDQFRKKASTRAAWIFGVCHAVICIKLFRRYITGDLLDNRLEMEWKWKSNAVLCLERTVTWIRGNWLVPAVVTAAILIGNVAIVKIFLDVENEPTWTTYTALGTGVLKSTLISLVMVWYLHKRPAGFFHSRYIPVRIFRYIIASGFLPASFVVSSVVCFCVLASGDISFLLSNFTVQLYVTSYLALLNIRSSRPSQYVDSMVSSPESTFSECQSNVFEPQTPPLVRTCPVPHPASMCTRTSSQLNSSYQGDGPFAVDRTNVQRANSTSAALPNINDIEAWIFGTITCQVPDRRKHVSDRFWAPQIAPSDRSSGSTKFDCSVQRIFRIGLTASPTSYPLSREGEAIQLKAVQEHFSWWLEFFLPHSIPRVEFSSGERCLHAQDKGYSSFPPKKGGQRGLLVGVYRMDDSSRPDRRHIFNGQVLQFTPQLLEVLCAVFPLVTLLQLEADAVLAHKRFHLE
ncbi:hypothetical protein DL96DRAFT_1564832 [Flagelloscypha sp. PMI_526]|nr:hypothetical protein DL96DRAFT_1564832 [Flagelloscypha sp. PMI_526]